jgi:fido (protein-threonine AMPylation protein)
VSDLFEQPDDATPLTAEEMRELIPAHIAYRRELNEAEQENIARAQDWALNRSRDLLNEKFVRGLHRRVQIHPFPNCNGRHARLMADLLVMTLGGERFSWGSANLQDAGVVRQRYIAALQAADDHDIGPLLAFARS